MSNLKGLTGERSDHKLAAVFDNEANASRAAEAVRSDTGLDQASVRVLVPGGAEPGPALEPESHGIWRTLVRSHVWLGVLGTVAGALLFAVLMAMDVAFVVDNVGWAFGLMVVLCGIAGLLLGGLVTLRPDHVPFILEARRALDEGKSVVIVHAADEATLTQARHTLDGLDERSVQTF